MRLKRLGVHNYKSLRSVTFAPAELAVLIGPNASGKSNFADALHFLSEVYSHGLEVAVARKGGFENIAFRKQRRTKASIDFSIELEAVKTEVRRYPLFRRLSSPQATLRLSHNFSLSTPEGRIKAEYAVRDESFRILSIERNQPEELLRISRAGVGQPRVEIGAASGIGEELRDYLMRYRDLFTDQAATEQELFLNSLLLRNIFFSGFSTAVSRFDVHQFSAYASRLPGVPTPNPVLSVAGENLPAIVDWLQRKHPDRWQAVLQRMQDILPSLSEIGTKFLQSKALGLSFVEDGVGRPWSADDVSDGTIQSLALLVAAGDPRSSLLLIEEPENSVHPWIIRVLVDQFRQISKTKNVILTTHSPVLIDLIRPEEAWVVSRRMGETSVRRLVELQPSILSDWKRGKFKLSEFLDAGFVPQAVPGGVE